jgi:glyoxylase-like metal-dependent hydrolase (beta-lactamase superfamily II)/glycine cleavage system regulatory protein
LQLHSFITRMPDHPGALHRAAEIVTQYGGNINRLHYDRRIDPSTVFFEITATEKAYRHIHDDLAAIGYLQTSLHPTGYLKCAVYLPHRPGTLLELLKHTTSANGNIEFVDFDDIGTHPDRLMMSLSVKDSARVDYLLNSLKSRYRLEIVEYDTTGNHLDDTVFYLWFAQKLRDLLGEAEDAFLFHLLQDINHIVQELMNRGQDPRTVFQSVLETGRSIRDSSGNAFSADIQTIPITAEVTLFCYQLPCGGNIFLFSTPEEAVLIDTGYGSYFPDVRTMLRETAFIDADRIGRILITHGDADHAGGAGYYPACTWTTVTTWEIIQRSNRAYGSQAETSFLEAVYTKLINAFSAFSLPRSVQLFPEESEEKRGIFPILQRITIGDIEFEVLKGLGGHLVGQIYLYSRSNGLLFTADTVINFESLTKERRTYSTLAVNLVTSVNVDSGIAAREREALLSLAAETDRALASEGKHCLICGGHGAVSFREEGKLRLWGEIRHYRREDSVTSSLDIHEN